VVSTHFVLERAKWMISQSEYLKTRLLQDQLLLDAIKANLPQLEELLELYNQR